MTRLTFNQLEAIYMLAKAQSKGAEWELTAEVELVPFVLSDKPYQLKLATLNGKHLYSPDQFEPIKINKQLPETNQNETV